MTATLTSPSMTIDPEINPKRQSARVYTSPNQFQEIAPEGTLDGGDVLPGFVLPLKRLFTRAERGA